MTKAQINCENNQKDIEPMFQTGLGLPIVDLVTEGVKKLQEAIVEQQEKTERLLKENKTHLY